MSSWTVYKAGRYAWTAHRKGKLPDKLFRTWREAMEYADRMARTVEIVLPRPDKYGYIDIDPEQIEMESTDRSRVAFAWLDDPETIGLHIGDCDHYMTTDGAHSIALALAALAEQEKP